VQVSHVTAIKVSLLKRRMPMDTTNHFASKLRPQS
jgi:hypothetical protein